jgi:hypothetical protein
VVDLPPRTISFDMAHFQRLKEVFFKPFAKMLRDHPYMMEKQPFELV